jgi:hypothetical protein
MDGWQVTSILWTIFVGALVLLSYYFILFLRIGDYSFSGMFEKPSNDSTKYRVRNWLWTNAYQSIYTWGLWCVTASSATVFYLIVVFRVLCDSAWSGDKHDSYVAFAFCNGFFLVLSLLYSFLMFRVFFESGENVQTKWSRVFVVVDVLCAAFFTWGMLICIVNIYDYGWEFGIFLILAFHCTVMDGIVWCLFWFKEPNEIFHKNNQLIFLRAALDTDPSTMNIFSRLRIRHSDYGALRGDARGARCSGGEAACTLP